MKKFFEKLLEKKWTREVAVAIVAAYIILTIVVFSSCGIITPTKAFVFRVEERCNLHLARYKRLLEGASRKELEELTGEKENAYKNISKKHIKKYKEQLEREINAFLSYLKANAELWRRK